MLKQEMKKNLLKFAYFKNLPYGSNEQSNGTEITVFLKMAFLITWAFFFKI